MRDEVGLPTAEIDIAFERPDREWSAGVTRPTVNLFLWDVRRNTNDQEAGMEMVIEDGRPVRRAPRPRVDCRYLVTSWAGDPRDEHQLLGTVLSGLLTYSEFPERYLPNGYEQIRPLPTINVQRMDGENIADFWAGLDGEMHPALDVVITATFDAGFAAEVGPPVREVEVETRRLDDESVRSRRSYQPTEEELEQAAKRRGLAVDGTPLESDGGGGD